MLLFRLLNEDFAEPALNKPLILFNTSLLVTPLLLLPSDVDMVGVAVAVRNSDVLVVEDLDC